ncbi:MAG: hypothetical protein ICV68_13045 [Pyrinomonadaceae bacterium]|nr:hypothetical protein [Pyrinomonadaceae bacterium]
MPRSRSAAAAACLSACVAPAALAFASARSIFASSAAVSIPLGLAAAPLAGATASVAGAPPCAEETGGIAPLSVERAAVRLPSEVLLLLFYGVAVKPAAAATTAAPQARARTDFRILSFVSNGP